MKSKCIRLTVVALLCAAFSAHARPVPSKNAGGEKSHRQLRIQPGKLHGTVRYADGKTPAARVPVRIWSIEERDFLAETVTDKGGAYALPKLREGRYIAIFGDRMRLEIIVDPIKGQATKTLKAVIPQAKSLATRKQIATELRRVGPAPPAGGQAGPNLGAWLSNPWVIAGTAATAIAVPVAIHNSHGSSGDDSESAARRGRRRRRVVSP